MKGHSSYIEKSDINDKNTNDSTLVFILKNIDAAVLLETSAHKIEFINNAYCSLFNITIPADHLLGMDSFEIAKASAYLFAEPEVYLNRLNQITEENITVSKEEIQLLDGRIFERDYKPVLIEDDINITGHFWCYKELSLTKKNNDLSATGELFYRNVLNNIPVDIAIYNKEHKYVFVNKSGIGNDIVRDWMVGKNDFDYSLSGNKGFQKALSRRNYFEQALDSSQIVQFEEKDINDKGQETCNLQHYYPCVNEVNEIEFVIGYGVNISRIRQNEKLLIKSLETYQNLIHNLDEVVFIVDQKNVLQYVNPLWENVFNKSYYESVGKPINTFFSPEVFKSIEKDLESIKKDNSVDKIKREIRIETVNGIIKHYNYYFSRFYGILKDEVMVSGYVVDITDQVNAREELLKVLQKERILSDMKTEFVNMVSHELRTPLSIIQSSAEILELMYKLENPSKETMGNYSVRIVDEVKNLKNLMDELLLISKIETDDLQFNPKEIDVISFVDEIISQHFNPWKDGRKIAMEIRGNSRLVNGDKFMLKHIINNILDNAFKYSMDKQAPMLRIFFGHDGWSLVCRDYGIGIPGNEINNLGSSFKRGSNSGFIQGTGLGLVVVNYFVDKHKGTVQYQSTIDKGTFVRISFPYLD